MITYRISYTFADVCDIDNVMFLSTETSDSASDAKDTLPASWPSHVWVLVSDFKRPHSVIANDLGHDYPNPVAGSSERFDHFWDFRRYRVLALFQTRRI